MMSQMRVTGTTLLCLSLAALLAGCSDKQPKKSDTPRTSTMPTDRSVAEPTTRPGGRELQSDPAPPLPPPTTASAPAGPVSTFDSTPPYPVELFVRDPEEKQPGWLKILELANKDALATVKGIFPEQNTIAVDTQNVRRLELHMGYLPLAPNKRVRLLIDKQGIELTRQRRYVPLERRPGGEWVVLPPPKE